MVIVKNSVQCLKCNEIIESRKLNDLKECCCGNISITGGKSKLTRLTEDLNSFKELSVTKEEEDGTKKETKYSKKN